MEIKRDWLHVKPTTEGIDVLATRMCQKHGKPMRPRQRNCHECNRLANEKYRESLKADLELGRSFRKIMGRKRADTATLRKAIMAGPSRPGFVYFIQADPGDEIKIGFSTHPARRLRVLQTAATRTLHILATTPGMQDKEYQIHQRFAAYRTIGEWFTPSDELLAFIQELNPTQTIVRLAS